MATPIWLTFEPREGLSFCSCARYLADRDGVRWYARQHCGRCHGAGHVSNLAQPSGGRELAS